MKETTGARLKQIMRDRKLKQIDILRMCEPYCKKYNVKLEKNDLSQYVNDKVQPKQDKLSILGMALNVPEIWLMGYDIPSKNEVSDEKRAEMNEKLNEFITLFKNATPEAQALVENFLKSSQQKP